MVEIVSLWPERIAELDVDLRSVEGGLARRLDVVQAEARHRVLQVALAALPHLGVVDVLLLVVRVPQRQAVPVVGDAEHAVDVLDELDHADDLVLDLLGRAEDVRVVEVHAPHAAQAAQLARLLVAPHRAELGDAHRQLAVAALLVLVDLDVVRAVHRPQDELFVARTASSGNMASW